MKILVFVQVQEIQIVQKRIYNVSVQTSGREIESKPILETGRMGLSLSGITWQYSVIQKLAQNLVLGEI